jgi:hypothetical protein
MVHIGLQLQKHKEMEMIGRKDTRRANHALLYLYLIREKRKAKRSPKVLLPKEVFPCSFHDATRQRRPISSKKITAAPLQANC